MRGRVLHLLPLLLFLALPRESAACGQCAFALCDRYFPPAVPWAIIGWLGYLLVGLFAPPPLDTPTGAFFKPSAILVLSICSIVASGIMGPIPFIGLVPLTLRGLWLSLKQSRARNVRIVASLLLVPLVVTSVLWTITWNRRSDVDFVLYWAGTNPARAVVLKMVAKNDLAGLRQVVSGPNGFEASQTAVQLAKIGNAAIDAPIMIEALRSIEGQRVEEFNIGTFNEALEALLHGKPPDGKKKAADWEEFFRNRPLPHGSL